MNLTKAQQYLIVGVLALGGLLFAYYSFLWKPARAEIVKLEKTLDDKRKELQAAKDAVARYAEFKREAAVLQRRLDWLTSRVPSDVGEIEVSRALRESLMQAGMSLTTFTRLDPGKGIPNPTAKLRDQPAEITAVGDYRGLLELLYYLSVSGLLVDYGKIRVLPVAGSSDETLTATLVVQGYGLK